MADDLLKKRLLELAERSYEKQIYTCTDFLSMAELSVFQGITRQINHIPYTMSGGMDGCERQLVRFGSADLCGYEDDLPITCLTAEPRSAKFAEKLTHRDFLGSLMGLGIERSAVGDIIVKDSSAYIFCLSNIADYIIDNFTQVRHTAVLCTRAETLPQGSLYTLQEMTVQVSSERLDAIIAHVWHLSRSDGSALFGAERVYINSALCTNSSRKPQQGDIVSVRGLGRFVYHGVIGTSKKGKLNISVSCYK